MVYTTHNSKPRHVTASVTVRNGFRVASFGLPGNARHPATSGLSLTSG